MESLIEKKEKLLDEIRNSWDDQETQKFLRMELMEIISKISEAKE